MTPLPPYQQNNLQNLLQNNNNNQNSLLQQSKIPTTLRRYQRKNNSKNIDQKRRLTLDLNLYSSTETIMFSSVNTSTISSSSSTNNSLNNNNNNCSLPPLPSPLPSSPLPQQQQQQQQQISFTSTSSSTYSRVHSLSRSQTPTNNSSSLNGSMTTICSGITTTQTLPREKPLASPKCFGKNTHILREEYERERLRWEKKLEESEQKLCEAAANNAELFQTKAELNRKIIDFEKSQKPLIDQNKRLNERLKSATTENKKLEQKMAFVQDEWLSLRDQYDRVLKENEALREQRAFPEKLEELGRYRNQVLEMSKCITALRQSAAEKDRRQEILRMRVSGQQESDRQSCAAGSEGSVEDSGSLGLDTITEDLDEDVDLTTELFNGRGTAGENVILRQQLATANDQLVELQKEIDNAKIENANNLEESTNHFKEELEAARKRERILQQQLANSQAQNELIEFQLVELTEGRQQQQQIENNREKVVLNDKNITTDISVPIKEINDFQLEEEENEWKISGGGLNKRKELIPSKIEKLKDGMKKAFEFSILGSSEKCAIKQGLRVIELLQQQLNFVETELNMSNCENGRLQRELEIKEIDIKKQKEEVQNERQQRKKELKIELELLKKERIEESAAYNHQVNELSIALNEKVHTLGDLNDKIAQLEAELDICRCQLNSSKKEDEFLRSKNIEMNKEIKRLTEELDKIKNELNKSMEDKQSSLKELNQKILFVESSNAEKILKLNEEKEFCKQQCNQLRILNRELESQFNTQMDLIGALKRKLLAQQSEPGKPSWVTATATRSCGSQSTEDEQYHSEGSSEDGGQQKIDFVYNIRAQIYYDDRRINK
ncbi:hypothetical protein Mgra_00000945 [Meloidogyne graminicola]|uniref:Uncharacterized protein n=1 Tax=Meloidogyne graminicola TaxID=189291 RepID=A0A8T0A207_9BILA|nr:hypothetical protein Mgra_00000945 [Meloidogyne graminicola]